MVARNRELNALVFTDSPAKNLSIAGIGAGLFNKLTGIADAFGRNQYTFGVHSINDATKALTLDPD